jgi:uncharacterized protein (DUF1015 family)
MAAIKEFKGIRPPAGIAHLTAELPYDVCSSEEAREAAQGNEYNFYHITKPEIDLPAGTDIYSDPVYAKGAENFRKFIEKGHLFEEKQPVLYFYTLIMNGREQTGLVCGVSVDDYINETVKKHEFTRADKEKDRIRHIDEVGAQTGLVFLLYKEDGAKKKLWQEALALAPEYDFTAKDGIRHIFRVISDRSMIEKFTAAFKNDILYIADGHHRAASAVKNALERRGKNSGYTGGENYNYFLSVVFPHDQLKIMPYNRVVIDLNGNTTESYFTKVGEKFTIVESGADTPSQKGSYSMYIENKWYTITPKFNAGNDPVASLDVSVLQTHLLAPILGIDDPRTSKRIDFIGGIRGTAELVKLVNSGKFKVAFSMYPTSIEDLIKVSDSGNVMPPKSTWFEPKLRDGLIVHRI